MPLQQTSFENTVTKGEIAQNEQFLLWPKYFQLYLIIMLLFIEIFPIFAKMFSKSSAADFLYMGKGEETFIYPVRMNAD